jgi:hypothetical protein
MGGAFGVTGGVGPAKCQNTVEGLLSAKKLVNYAQK